MENNNILTYSHASEAYTSTLKGIKKREEKLKYNTVIKAIFNNIVNEIIINQKIYSFLGIFSLKGARLERDFDTLAVNWGESNKRKKELLEQGKKPAVKIGTSQNGNPIFDDGERWMVFYTDDFYFDLSFNHFKNTKELYKFISFWKFKRNVKFMERVNKAIEDKLITLNNFPIHNGSTNNFI